MPGTLSEFVKWVASPEGMCVIAGFVGSLLIGNWPWFCAQSSVLKRIIVFVLCVVIGLGASYVWSPVSVTTEQVYLVSSLAFIASQAADLKNQAEKDRAKIT